MRKYIWFLPLVCLCLALIMPAHAQSATEKSYLIPKYITADEENRPIYDGQLAEFLRKASSDAYAVYDGKLPSNLVSTGFTDYVYSYHTDESVFYEMLGSDDKLVRVAIPLKTHFVTASTRVTVGGRTHNIVIISFQGTVLEELPLLTDLMVFDALGFHAGFISAAQAAYNYLSTSVSYRNLGMTFGEVLEKTNDPESGYHILVTGHSLGGAVANLFTSKLLNEAVDNRLNTLCYTYACPLVCDDWRADLLDGSNIINIINTLDIVPYVGYQLKNGTRPGHEVSDAVLFEELDDVLDSHRINHGYKELLALIDQDTGGHYPALYCSKTEDAVIHTDIGGNGKGVLIPIETLDRFQGQQLIVHGEYNLQDDVIYPFSEMTVQGGSLDGSAKNAVLPCDLVIESGSFALGTGTVTVNGDLRIQKHADEGTFVGGTGHLLMEDAGHLLVTGDVWFQGGSTNYLYRPDMTAGTLELKGNFYVLPSTGEQCELSFCPKGNHKVLLSGEEQQTIHFAPYVSDSSYAVAAFCHLETVNPKPLLAPYPISMQYIEDDLVFEGDLGLSSYGDMIVLGVCTIKADNIRLDEDAHPDIFGQLTLDGNVTGGRLDIGKYEAAAGKAIITGDLTGTDLYYKVTTTPSAVEIRGNYLNNNADLCLCDGLLQIRGDFRHQVQVADDLYAPVNAPFASIYDGARIEVDGNFYLQQESEESFSLPGGCAFVLKGDFHQICDVSDPNFWNYGLSNLILAGTSAQTVDAPTFHFTDITLANSSKEGVTFLHELYGLSGIFNAFGRADGTATPFRFPKDVVPDWVDSDEDNVPDCLDPDPETNEPYDHLPVAISEGVLDDTVIRFFYSPVQEEMPEKSVVWLALYDDGRMVELRQESLCMEIYQIYTLEIDLAARLNIDAVKVFQVQTDSFSPLWFSATWKGNEPLQ